MRNTITRKQGDTATEIFVIINRSSGYSCGEHYDDKNVVWAGTDKEEAIKETFRRTKEINRRFGGNEIITQIWVNGEFITDTDPAFYVPA